MNTKSSIYPTSIEIPSYNVHRISKGLKEEDFQHCFFLKLFNGNCRHCTIITRTLDQAKQATVTTCQQTISASQHEPEAQGLIQGEAEGSKAYQSKERGRAKIKAWRRYHPSNRWNSSKKKRYSISNKSD